MIEIRGVSKRFGRVVALDRVSFEVRNGEVVGYVGPNGAGKTTTIRIAVGVLPPDAGDVYIDGYSVLREKALASSRVGWVPESPIFEQEFKALDYFTYLATYKGLSPSDARRLGRELLNEVGLGDAANRKLSTFSQGMKKRFALAVSMIGDPPNFIFDEVLSGLDPQGIAFFRGVVEEFRRRGKAVLFSSHILTEVQMIAQRVVFINRGRIVGVYTADEIARLASPAIRIRLKHVDENVKNLLTRFGSIEVSENTVILREPRAEPSKILEELVKSGYSVEEFRISEERCLEELFMKLIKGEKV